MTASTDPITITPVDGSTTAIRICRGGHTMDLSISDCRAIVDASGLTARFDVLHKNTAQLIISLANHIAALEKASDTARKAEIGESYSAGMRDGQACAGGGEMERERDHFADASKMVEAGMRDAQAEIHQLKEIRKDWAMERDAAIARATEAEDRAALSSSYALAARRTLGEAVARAEKAEAGLKDAIAMAHVINRVSANWQGHPWPPLHEAYDSVFAFLKQHGGAS